LVAVRDTPINVFGRSTDAAAIARLVGDAVPGAAVEPLGAGFVISATPKRRLLRTPGREVTVSVRSDHFDGDDGHRQRVGMASFLATTMGGPGLADVLAMAPDMRVAVALQADPGIEAAPQDDLFRLALDIARLADGFVLSVGQCCVWSADGGVLASADLRPTADPTPGGDGPEDFAPDPPSADRVAKRLLVLTALAARGLAEADGDLLDEARSGILTWVDELGLGDEVEPFERMLLETPAGEMGTTEQLNASWRTEGAALLAWALGVLELTPHDRPIVARDLSLAVGFPDAESTLARIGAPSLRPVDEIDAMRSTLFAVHWRLREQSIRPRAMDFVEFASTAWFGPLEIEAVAMIDRDLAIGDRAISEAEPGAIGLATSVVMERHLAVNWLLLGGVYSETDVST
jgi:hypothetical protein